MAVIVVSGCLLGCNCRYKGDNCKNEKILAWAKENTIIGVCPEQMGGLSTPRDPAEIVGDRLITKNGVDVTSQYHKGAEAALLLAKLNKADFAIVKYRSPACGKGMIYDGTFSGKLIPGDGIFVRLLKENHIPVYSENELDQLPLK